MVVNRVTLVKAVLVVKEHATHAIVATHANHVTQRATTAIAVKFAIRAKELAIHAKHVTHVKYVTHRQ